MYEELRAYLYPLGFIASIAFSLRFLVQWISSEKKKTSAVSSLFWKISLFGNIVMTIHSFIQVQYPFTMIQAFNAVIAWRNLNLMKGPQKSLKFTFALLFIVLACITLLFIVEGLYLYGFVDWIRTPTLPWDSLSGSKIALPWHIIGFLGATIFAMRFWVQWWLTEKHLKSYLGKAFWWLSIVGALIALSYFIRLNDWVNILGYGMGIVPYIRNLILMHRNEALQTS
ncbi:MAG: lipid-A-disaccharide synthase N-terminal domain-containing protein [Chlamydiales bacterium]|nr:lipid-A-disaccharide synthase N-terminal domain-containing protein [Chlamydiales bacterium]